MQTLSNEGASFDHMNFRSPNNTESCVRSYGDKFPIQLINAHLSTRDLQQLRKLFDGSKQRKTRQTAANTRKVYRPNYFLVGANQSFNIASKVYASRAYSFADTEAYRRKLASLFVYYPFLLPPSSKPVTCRRKSQRPWFVDASVQCSPNQRKEMIDQFRSMSIEVGSSLISEENANEKRAKEKISKNSEETDITSSVSKEYSTSFSSVPCVQVREIDEGVKEVKGETSNDEEDESEDGYASDFEAISLSNFSDDRENVLFDAVQDSRYVNGSLKRTVELVSRSVQVSENEVGLNAYSNSTDEDHYTSSFEVASQHSLMSCYPASQTIANEVVTNVKLPSAESIDSSVSGSYLITDLPSESQQSISTVIDFSRSISANSKDSLSSSLASFGKGVRKLQERLEVLRASEVTRSQQVSPSRDKSFS
ncbi:unnamed protein product [Soboliphyme baturini]|uniref:Dentin sialophosphoprotein-like n=1 Tax=Soboliphyme baturini TaxID=241478 RepID=A0A183II80_9BILA|nr:unnamed protein product [Soboliphyme baturini]